MTEPKLKHVHLEHEGLEMFLGKIEAAVLVTLWEYGPLSSNKLQKYLLPTGDWAWQTIATTCERLTVKGYVQHDRKRAIFIPAFDTEDKFIDFCICRILTSLNNYYPTSLQDAIAAKGLY